MIKKSIFRTIMTTVLSLVTVFVLLPALGQADKAYAKTATSLELKPSEDYTLPLDDPDLYYLESHVCDDEGNGDKIVVTFDDGSKDEYLCSSESWIFKSRSGQTISLFPDEWEDDPDTFVAGGSYLATIFFYSLPNDLGSDLGISRGDYLDPISVTIVDEEPVFIENIKLSLDSNQELQLMETDDGFYDDNTIEFHNGDRCVVDYTDNTQKTFVANEYGEFYNEDDENESLNVYLQWVKADGIVFDGLKLKGTVGNTYDVNAFVYRRTDGNNTYGDEIYSLGEDNEKDKFPVKIVGYEWEVEYKWAEDFSSVKATATRKDNSGITKEETVNTTSEITKYPNDTEMGETTYTATFTKTPFTTQKKTIANIPLRDYIVTGGTEGTDYTYQDGVLKFLKDGSYTVRMRTGMDVADDKIEIYGGGDNPGFNNMDLTLDNLNIDAGDKKSVEGFFGKRTSNFNLNVILKGTNVIKSNAVTWYNDNLAVDFTIKAESGTISDSLLIENGTINPNDSGFSVGNFTLKSGMVTFDAIQSAGTGKEIGMTANKTFRVDGGKLYVNSPQSAGAVYCNHQFVMNGGDVTIETTGTQCIHVVGAADVAGDGVIIKGGKLTLTSNGTSGAATITTGDRQKKNILIDTDGTVTINTNYYGISTFNGGNVTMKNGSLMINGGNVGIVLDDVSGRLFVEGGETEIQSRSAIHLNNEDKTVNFADSYVHKNYSGDKKENRTAIEDSEILPMAINGVKVAEPYLLITPAYPITYDLNDGSLAEETENPDKYSKIDAFTLNNPSKEGYDFIGWTGTGLDNPTETVSIPIDGVAGALSFKANYKLREYLIQFKTGDGASEVSDQTVKHGDKIDSSLVDPEKDGYTLEGWYEDEGLTKAFDLSTNITETKTLYAKWTENTATLKYVVGKGGSVSSKSETVNVITGEAAGSTATPESEYEFVDWTDEEGNTICTTATFVPEKTKGEGGLADKYISATYIANFRIPEAPPVDTYTIKFETNGGSAVESQTVESGSRIDTTKISTARDGYELEGWYTDEALTKAFDLGTKITESETLYAKWAENEATITYVAGNGGNVSSKSETVNVITGTAAGSTASAEGDYEFICWTDSQGVTVSQNAAFVPEKKDGKYTSATYIANFKLKDSGKSGDEIALIIPPADMTYNGQPQTAYSDTNEYTVKNGTATDAGTYTAVLTPKDGFVWPDGTSDSKEVTYTIAKATLTAEYTGETIEWYEKPEMEVKVTGFVNGETAKIAKDYKAPKATAPGYEPHNTYSVEPAGGSAANYTFKYVSGKLTVNCKTVIMAKAKAGKSKATVSWMSVPGATGYKIYGGKCGRTFKLMKTVKGQKLKTTIKKLKKSSYKFYVVAYRSENGKTITLSESPKIHVIINNAIKGHSNPTGIKVNKTSVTIESGNTDNVKGTIVCKKKPLDTTHTAHVRYKSSDSHIAEVDKSGKITGKRKGECKIYVYTQNGIRKEVSVTVN